MMSQLQFLQFINRFLTSNLLSGKSGFGADTSTFDVDNIGDGTMPWTASIISGADWLNIESGSSGIDNGTIAASYPANTSGATRTGTIQVIVYYLNGIVTHSWDVTVVQSANFPSWGDDSYGQVSNSPTGDDFIAISGGAYHSLALKGDGSIVSWGDDSYGQVSNTPTGNDFIAISAEAVYSLALKNDGSIVSWGWDSYYSPVNNTPTGNDFIDISAGRQHSLALKSDGSIVSWGYDPNGLTTNTPTGDDFIAISGGAYHSLALKGDGSIVSWGENSYGQVSNTPTGNDFIAISAGTYCNLALKSDGSIVSWGEDSDGQVSNTPTGNDFIAISAGSHHSLALKSDGSIVSWGSDFYGQVGDTPSGNGFNLIAAGFNHSSAFFGSFTAIPNVAGLSQDDAEASIISSDLMIGLISKIYSDTVPVGNVIRQSPIGGSLAVAGSAVNIVISLGVKDVDNDGLPDDWEQQIINADPTDDINSIEDVDPLDDFDKDGYSNLRESLSDTDPTSNTSFPECLIDADKDSDFDGIDLSILCNEIGTMDCSANPSGCMTDFDQDNDVDEVDLFLFNEEFGRVCNLNPGCFEDFEVYSLNTWPSPDWVKDANASSDPSNNIILIDPTDAGNKVLKLFGQLNSCWGALAYKQCSFPEEFSIEVRVFNGSEVLSGCHPDRAYVGLRQGTSWSNPSRPLIQFLGNGNIVAGDGSILQGYQTDQWYDIKILYKRNDTDLNLKYYINGLDRGQIEISITDLPSEISLDHIDLAVQEGSAYFDDVEIRPIISEKIAVINPDYFRILKQGIKANYGTDTEEFSTYFSIADGQVSDGCDFWNNPTCWTGVGEQSDFIGTILEIAGYNVEYYEAADMPLLSPSEYKLIIIQDPLKNNVRRFNAQEAELLEPDLLEYVNDPTFLSRLDDYIDSGGNVLLVGDSVKLLEERYGKIVSSYNIGHQVDQESFKIPYKWLFIRGNPFCGSDRTGSAVSVVESSSIITPGSNFASLNLNNLNDLPTAETWSETIYFPDDGTSLLDIRFSGSGEYVLIGTTCSPPQYTCLVDDTVQQMMGYTTYNGNRIYYIGSDAFFDYHYINHNGASHASQFSEISYSMTEAAKNAIVDLVELAISPD